MIPLLVDCLICLQICSNIASTVVIWRQSSIWRVLQTCLPGHLRTGRLCLQNFLHYTTRFDAVKLSLQLTCVSTQYDTLCRHVSRSENLGGRAVLGGDNVPPLVEIGLTDLPKTGGAYAPPAPSFETCLLKYSKLCLGLMKFP